MQAKPLLCLSSDFMSSVCVFVICIFSFDYYKCSLHVCHCLVFGSSAKKSFDQSWGLGPTRGGREVLLQSNFFFKKLAWNRLKMEFTLYMNEITIQLDCTAHWGHFCVFHLSPFCLHLYLHFLFRLLLMVCLVCIVYFFLQKKDFLDIKLL